VNWRIRTAGSQRECQIISPVERLLKRRGRKDNLQDQVRIQGRSDGEWNECKEGPSGGGGGK